MSFFKQPKKTLLHFFEMFLQSKDKIPNAFISFDKIRQK